MLKLLTVVLLIAVMPTGCASRDSRPPEPKASSATYTTRYDFFRSWAEQRAPTSGIPPDQRIFVMSLATTNYAAIVRHQPGILVAEVVAETKFASDAKAATIYRARNVVNGNGPASGFSVILNAAPAARCEIQPMDVLEIHTTLPIIFR